MRIRGEHSLRVGEPDRSQHVVDVDVCTCERVAHLLADPLRRIERGDRVLEHEPDVLASQGADGTVVEPEDRLPEDRHVAAGPFGAGGKDPADRGSKGALARAALADDTDDLTGLHHEVGAVQRTDRAGASDIVDRQATHFECDVVHVRLRAARGSRRSRSPSPRRFTDRIASASTPPGINVTHGAMVR